MRDHPREYGENCRNAETLLGRWGSSPRIRGESPFSRAALHRNGIIPANTGRIFHVAHGRVVLPDHPREYGENASTWSRASTSSGSSPRIRGECCSALGTKHVMGIIPANTGRIAVFACSTTPERDHPREYGENFPCCSWSRCPSGSSPRIRGESAQFSGL